MTFVLRGSVPQKMWWQVLEALGPPERTSETLESLSPELKAQIRDCYQAMQPVCYSNYLARLTVMRAGH